MAYTGHLLAYASHQTLPSSTPFTSDDGIDPLDGLAVLPLALGAANITYGADTSTDDDGGNGWISTHSSIVGPPNHYLLLQLFVP